jgi:hypothetical protein
MARLDPEVARLIGQLAGEGIEVFVPRGAEGSLSVEDGNLVIRGELLEVTEIVRCIACGYDGPDLDHVCGAPVVSAN